MVSLSSSGAARAANTKVVLCVGEAATTAGLGTEVCAASGAILIRKCISVQVIANTETKLAVAKLTAQMDQAVAQRAEEWGKRLLCAHGVHMWLPMIRDRNAAMRPRGCGRSAPAAHRLDRMTEDGCAGQRRARGDAPAVRDSTIRAMRRGRVLRSASPGTSCSLST